MTFILDKIYPSDSQLNIFYRANAQKNVLSDNPKVNQEIFTYISDNGLVQICISNQGSAQATISLKSYQGIFSLKDHRQIDLAALSRGLDGFLGGVQNTRTLLNYVVEKVEADSSTKPFYNKLKEALFT